MKKHLHLTLLAAACSLALSAGTQAAAVAFEYTDPADFRDIRATDTSQPRFQQRVLRELEEQFREEAATLPEGQILHVTMKNVDLAGEIEYFYRNHPFGVRVIRDIDFPRVEFSYELRDAEGGLLRSGDEKIHDMGFRFGTFTEYRHNREALEYEKALISDWYASTF